jgi:hypothetical protein
LPGVAKKFANLNPTADYTIAWIGDRPVRRIRELICEADSRKSSIRVRAARSTVVFANNRNLASESTAEIGSPFTQVKIGEGRR